MITSFDMEHRLSDVELQQMLEAAKSEGFAAGLEAGAEMAEAEAELNNQSISAYAPCNVGGDGSREVRIGGRSAARHIAIALRERAREEKAKL
jgi:hypothetical protein